MNREERIEKLKNGSETAMWAAEEIERLEIALKEIEKFGHGVGYGRGFTCANIAKTALTHNAKSNPRDSVGLTDGLAG
ncbi:hypothetical protein [Methylomonas sp. CM2]|uniref:hypothetical protein n=1 Tax=Methylomonas sp. CM2 TaxID=3417647 RepID=UPI003CF5AB33